RRIVGIIRATGKLDRGASEAARPAAAGTTEAARRLAEQGLFVLRRRRFLIRGGVRLVVPLLVRRQHGFFLHVRLGVILVVVSAHGREYREAQSEHAQRDPHGNNPATVPEETFAGNSVGRGWVQDQSELASWPLWSLWGSFRDQIRRIHSIRDKTRIVWAFLTP